MHELSLAQGILEIAESALNGAQGVQIRRIGIEVGSLSGVEPAALRFALASLAPDSVIADAEVDLVERAATAWCLRCAQVVEMNSRADACPRCAGHQLQPLSGTELRVLDLHVLDILAPTTTNEAAKEE